MADSAPSGPDVFLSYAREDEARARQLAAALEEHGFSVFWDREVPPGRNWHNYIGEALSNARCVVVAWSRHSIASPWVLEEAGEGRDRNVLVPVLLETVAPPFGFRAMQAAKLTEWHPGRPSIAFDSLVGAVERIVGGQRGSGAGAEAEAPGAPQSESSEAAPKTGPSATPAVRSRDTRLEPRSSSEGQARAWPGRTVMAMIAVVAVLASGALVWWLTQPGPAPPAPLAESEPAEPEPGSLDPSARTEASAGTSAPTEAERPTPAQEASAPSGETEARAAAPSPSESDEIPDCPECPEMVLVPAGEFTMGSPPGELGREDDEGPQRTVTIAKRLWVGKHEVTFAEWDACVAAGGCSRDPSDAGWGRDDRPVIHVSWNDAKAYVFWLSQKTGLKYRLLSEAEWEYAARASSTTAFWWGQGVGSDNANCNGCGGGWGNSKTAPVRSFRANVFDLYDTAGNIWEWVEDCYHDNYEGAPTDGAPRLDGECTDRVLRGGAWNTEPKFVRSASRHRSNPDNNWSIDLGFRVARAAD